MPFVKSTSTLLTCIFFCFLWNLPFLHCFHSRDTLSFIPLTTLFKEQNWVDWDRVIDQNPWSVITPHVDVHRPFPSLANLDVVLTPFGTQNCLVQVDNFKPVDFSQLHYPVHLRHPVLAFVQRNWRSNNISYAWIMKTEAIRNITFATESDDDNMRLEKLIMSYNLFPEDDDIHHDYPVLHPINVIQHSTRTRPWNCHVHILLYPPFGTRVILPPALWHPFATSNLAYQFPSRVPKVYLFLFNPRVQHTLLARVYRSDFLPVTSNFNNILLLGDIVHKRDNSSMELSTIEQIYILQSCFLFLCIMDGWSTEFGVWKQQVSTQNLSLIGKLELLTFPYFNAGLHLKILGDPYSSDSALANLLRCEAPPSFLLATATAPSHTSITAAARAHVWQSIYKNYSLQFDGQSFPGCILNTQSWHGIVGAVQHSIGIVPIRLDYKMLVNRGHQATLAFPVSTVNRLDSLQFVSCGQRGYHSFPYHEFISVFDLHTWTLLTILYAAVLPVLLYIFHKASLHPNCNDAVECMFSGWKILLEQGDKFVSGFGPHCGLQLGSTVFILVGVVLSNAYKNTNVYNMIAPRVVLPYETLDELIQDKFTLLTRIADVHVDINYNDPNEIILVTSQHGINDLDNQLVAAHSEVAELHSDKHQGNDSLRVISTLYNHSKIHRGVTHIIRGMINSVAGRKWNASLGIDGKEISHISYLFMQMFVLMLPSSFQNSQSFLGEDEPEIREKKEFFEKQENLLFNYIDGCNKSAILLTRYDCSKVAKQLVDNKHKHVFIGKEAYKNVTEVYTLLGFIPTFLQRRIKSMEMSGIWEWWNRVIENRYIFVPDVKDELQLQRPTMAGNILVIFVELLSGLATASAVFLVETRQKVYQTGKRFLYALYFSARMFEKVSQLLERDMEVCSFKSHLGVVIYKSV